MSIRTYEGPAVWSHGFRPFFLSGAAWAALAVPIWVFTYEAGIATIGGMTGRDWHVHEMLFGYLAAVVGGFLLTAVPNWTGRLPVQGWRLACLWAAWAAGRLVLLTALPEWVAVPVDLLFLVAMAAVIAREVLSGRNWRNLPVCLMVTLFALAHVAYHLRDSLPPLALAPEQAALAVGCMLITLIGGRIVPSFTRNWLMQQGARVLPSPFGMLDKAALLVTGAALTAWILFPFNTVSGGLLAVAGVTNLVRLVRWKGLLTGAEPLVWILHVGYVWLAAGLILLGASILTPIIPRSSGVHALTAGAIGVMTLAVMTRATLGHTGRERRADLPTTALYLLANAAAVTRVAAPLLPQTGPWLFVISAAFWIAAFGGFAWLYGPMLLQRRRA